MSFKVGDRVAWGGKSAPHIDEHSGTVFEVVPAGEMPVTSFRTDACVPRKHESYVVREHGGRVFWPRVSHLRADVNAAHDRTVAS